MNKLSKEKQQQLIIVIAVAVVVIAGLCWFVIGAQFSALGKTKKAIADIEAKIKSANDLIKDKDNIAAALKATGAKLTAIEETMASGDLFSWGVNMVKNYSVGRAVDVPNFSREERIKAGLLPEFPYEAVKYTVRGTAFYLDLGKFVAAFENDHPYMRVQNLVLDPIASNDPALTPADRERLNFKMEIVALIQPDPEVEKARKENAAKAAALKAAGKAKTP
jgi:hypothetical protein